MKKVVSLLLSLVMAIGGLCCFAEYQDSAPALTIDELTAMTTKMNIDYAELPSSYRLIVYSDEALDTLDAVDCIEGYEDLHILQFDNEKSADRALQYYQSCNAVSVVEPDEQISVAADDVPQKSAGPDILYYAFDDGHLSWGSTASGFCDFFDLMGGASALPEIEVAIIDSGIEYDHEFLADRVIRTNYDATGSSAEQGEYDVFGHGTSVAGVIADNTSDNVKLRAYKVVDDSGYSSKSNCVAAIYRAISDGVDVINISLCGAKTGVYQAPINKAVNNNVAVCVSAGNNQKDAASFEPACVEQAITVASVNREGALAKSSNVGNLIDILAPGVLIRTTALDNNYTTVSGTSFAAPFVSAAVALIKTKFPEYSVAEIDALLKENGIPSEFASVNYAPYLNLSGLLQPDASSGDELTPGEHIPNAAYNPVFNYESGVYDGAIALSIYSDCEEATQIYYTIYDYFGESYIQEETLYHGNENEIILTQPCCVVAYAYGERYKGKSTAYYFLTEEPSYDAFEIDSSGTVTDCHIDAAASYIVVPDTVNDITVRAIGSNVFRRSALKGIALPSTCAEIKSYAFYGADHLQLVIADNIQTVGDYAFSRTMRLKEMNLSSCEFIGEYGFGKSGLEEVVSDALVTIGDSAFAISLLQNIIAPNLEAIGETAFYNANNLRSVSFEKVSVLPAGVFDSCSQLRAASFPALTELNSNGGQFSNCSKLSAGMLDLGEYSGAIPQRMFAGSGIKSFDNAYITEISNDAFCETPLTYVRLKSCTFIGLNAFRNCAYLKEVYMPALTAVKGSPFLGCALESAFVPKLTDFLPEIFATSTDPAECAHVTLFLNPNISDNCLEIIQGSANTYKAYPYMVYTEDDSPTDTVCELLEWERYDISTLIVPQYAAIYNDLIYFKYRLYGIKGVSKYVYEDLYGIEYKVANITSGSSDLMSLDDSNNMAFSVINKKTHTNDFYIGFEPPGLPLYLVRALKLTAVISYDGFEFRSTEYSTSDTELKNNELFPDCEHEYAVYDFRDGIAYITCIECADEFSVSFEDYLGTDYALLDANGDGVVNTKDYALLMKEYNNN